MSGNVEAANTLLTDTAVEEVQGNTTGGGRTVGNPQLLGATILMVDDEPITMEVTQAFLEEAGYRNFITIDHSPSAMAAIVEQRPDLVLLDLMMPEVSGIEILQAARCNPDLKYLPIIILTSSTDSETKLQALELGATDFLAKPVDSSELCLRVRNTLAAKAYQDQLAYFDALTGLINRRTFLSRLTAVLRGAGESRDLVAILYINLDRFKRINESLGPKKGDAVLREVGYRLQKGVRSEDLVARDSLSEGYRSLSRLGGDEFAVMLNDIPDLEKAAAVSRRILDVLKTPIHIDDCEVFVTASIGIAAFPEDGEEPDLLLKHASSAGHSAKQRGANTYMFYSHEVNERSIEKLRLEGQLRKALDNDELVLYYQPKIRGATGRVSGVEALLRWQHPELGLLAPLRFIPLAEESELIVAIDDWVLNEACRQAMAWQAAGIGPLTMAVNICPQRFQERNLANAIETALLQTSLSPKLLTIELTETVVMEGAERNISTLHQIKEMGIDISVDDFGTGYSSLSYLKRFPLDELKIDRSFVMDVHANPDDEAIVGAIVAMSRSLGLRVVAEGVETAEQLAILKKYACDYYQGYLFSKPISSEELVARLRAKSARSETE